MATSFSVHSSNIGIYVDGELLGLDKIVERLYAYEQALDVLYSKMEPAYKLAGQFKAYLEQNNVGTSALQKAIDDLEIQIKSSDNTSHNNGSMPSEADSIHA